MEVIYYPTFEVINPQWLKFALLYLEKLDPIIPLAGDAYLSDEFKQIRGQTDLIDIHRPKFREGYSATLDALEHLEKVLEHPERYAGIFQPNFIDRWKTPNEQTARLFQDKYTSDWSDFCLANGLGRQTNTGLMVNQDVGMLYMTLLAQVIADGRGISPITDNPLLDRFSIFTRRPRTPDSTSMETAQAVIDLDLPANLSNISLDEVIAHRNRSGFKERLKAFHQELDAFMSNAEQRKKPGDFGGSLGSAWADFKDDFLRLGAGLTGFSLGVWIMLGSGAVEPLKAAQQIVGGLTIAIGSGIAIRNTWSHTETKRLTRKYLTDLGNMKLQSVPG